MIEIPLEVKVSIEKRLSELKKGKESIIQLMTEELKNTLQGMSNYIVGIEGREKSVDSIYSKMKSNNCNVDKIHDILGARVILKAKTNCYKVREVIRTKYKEIGEETEDYIKSPKENGYKGLHIIVTDLCNRVAEIQIRDEDMHEIAETGSASHKLYKNNQWQIQKQKA